MDQNIYVTKASGEKSLFSTEKIRRSLSKSGASNEQIELVIEQVSNQLYEGITTKKIYQIAYSILKGLGRHTAARYHLKRAIMELGPSGFPFEKYLGEILKYQGYSIQIGQIIQGKCVTHEIDIIAKKNDQLKMIECKYHNHPGIFCDVKIPLYIHARFEDIKTYRQQAAGQHNAISGACCNEYPFFDRRNEICNLFKSGIIGLGLSVKSRIKRPDRSIGTLSDNLSYIPYKKRETAIT